MSASVDINFRILQKQLFTCCTISFSNGQLFCLLIKYLLTLVSARRAVALKNLLAAIKGNFCALYYIVLVHIFYLQIVRICAKLCQN